MKRQLTFLLIIIFVLGIMPTGIVPGIIAATAGMDAIPGYVSQWIGGSHGIAISSSGSIYVADTFNYGVKKYDSSGNLILQFGSQGSGDGEFETVTGVAIHSQGIAVDPSGNVYVVDPGNDRVQKFDSNGSYLSQFGVSGNNEGEFNRPYEIAIDASGSIYVTNNDVLVQKYDSGGNYLSRFGGWGNKNGEFMAIRGMAFDSSGNIYVVDSGDSTRTRIQKFDSSGNYISKFGSWGTGDGQFQHPQGIAIDNCGNIYVIDKGSYRVEKFDSSGNYILQWGSYGSSKAPNTFWYPRGIAIDSSNNAYVLDRDNGNIQKFYLSDCTDTVYIPTEEREALIAFYSSTQGNLWSNVGGWLGNPGTECSWEGITCNEEQSHIVGINLSYHSFNDGEFPQEMGNLTYLKNIYLRNFHLTGNFPIEFANLTNLKILSLNENNLSGPIPSELKSFFMRTWASLGLDGNDLCTDDEELRDYIYSFEGHHITLPACTPAVCAEDTWSCGAWSDCSSAGQQTRTCEMTSDCATVETNSPATTQSCTPPGGSSDCTADTWSCGNWGKCSTSEQQTRTCEMTYNCLSASTPSPATSQSCAYIPQATSYWKLDEGSGNIAHDSTNNLDGDIKGAAYWSEDAISGKALIFDAANDYILLPSDTSGFSKYSITAWIKHTDSTNRQVIFEEGSDLNGINLYLHYNKLYGGVYAAGSGHDSYFINHETTIADDNWHFVALTYDSAETSLRLYLDGEVESVLGYSKVIPENSGARAIGAMNNKVRFESGPIAETSPNFHFRGLMDEIKIYRNIALSPSEVENEYNRFNPQCTEDSWACGEWSSCSSNGQQTRSCKMTFNCASIYTPAVTSRACTPSDDSAGQQDDCTEDIWECGDWSTCSSGGQKTRGCIKTNDCSTVESAPPLTIDQCFANNEIEDYDDLNSGQNITIINIIIDKLKIDIKQMVKDAGYIINNVFIGSERDLDREGKIKIKYTEKITKNKTKIKLKVKEKITSFITYGTPTTLRLGEGERAGVVNSYLDAFDLLPENEDDWEDVVKIANGRWPGKKNKDKEKKMKKDFKRIYLREPDEDDPHDDAALTVMSYGLRPAGRNLNSERAAIKIFRDIYDYKPETAVDWDIVRAIAYSGATR